MNQIGTILVTMMIGSRIIAVQSTGLVAANQGEEHPPSDWNSLSSGSSGGAMFPEIDLRDHTMSCADATT